MEVTSLGELISEVSDRLNEDNQIIWFRGQRDASWDVMPSIWRSGNNETERDLVNRFRARAANRIAQKPKYESFPEWLTIMQHYGLPTRLLDWSRSPLIAAYFALEYLLDDPKAKPIDAKIWLLKPHALNKHEGFEDITPSIDAWMCQPLLIPAFKKREETEKILATMGSEHDMRIFVQQGCFTIHSRKEPLNKSVKAKDYLSSITIPSSSAHAVAFQLKACGFHRGDIYPDLANLSLELKNTRMRI